MLDGCSRQFVGEMIIGPADCQITGDDEAHDGEDEGQRAAAHVAGDHRAADDAERDPRRPLPQQLPVNPATLVVGAQRDDRRRHDGSQRRTDRDMHAQIKGYVKSRQNLE